MTMNGLGLDGAWAIAEALAKNTTLEVLDISANRILTDGAFEIAKSLELNKTLLTLKVILTHVLAFEKGRGTLVHALFVTLTNFTRFFHKKTTRFSAKKKKQHPGGALVSITA